MLLSGKVVDKTFNADTKVDTANVDRRDMQYLYHDGSGFVFMDTTTYDQLTIPDQTVGDAKNYHLEGASGNSRYARRQPALSGASGLGRAGDHLLPSPVCKVTAALAVPSRPPLRLVYRSRFRCS